MERQGDCPHDHAFVELMAGPGEADIQLFIRETEEKLRLNSCSIEKSLQDLQAKIGESWAGDKGASPTECLQRFSQHNLSVLKPVSTDHQELLDFLKALQHLLKTEEAHEEAVVHLLLNISSQSGVAFPSSSFSSDRSQASMAPFCSIHDDLTLAVQETWDDICHVLGHYLLDKLSMEGAAVPLRIHLLQQLCFLYPETEVLEKYRALQSKAVLEVLRKTQSNYQGGEQGFGKLSQIFQTVGPGFCAMLSEDMHVLNRIYEPHCILDFLSQAYLSTLVKELEILMETEVEAVLKDSTTSGRKSRRSSGKKAAVAPQEDPSRGRNFYLTSHQLNCLAQLASTLLELERRVEDLSAELGFLNCAGESTSVLRGGTTKGLEEAEVLEGKATPDLLLQTTEVLCLQFEWRAAFRTLVPQMAHCVKVVLEDICNKSLQQEESMPGSSPALIPLVPVSQNHGADLTCSERDTPKMVAKFCGDVMEKLDALLPLAVACKNDALLPVRSCYVEVCGRVSSALLTRLDERFREVPQTSPYKNLPTLLASSSYIHHRLAYYESQLPDASCRPLTLLPIRRSQEVTEAIHEHLTSYCVHVCASSLLQDAESHHWADDKPFYEGERCSFSVQMWHYFLSALRTDLWDTVPPVLAQQILAQVLAQTLELLVQRYSRAQPSYKRLAQIRVDITAVLLRVEQLLWSVCGGVEELIRPEPASGTWVSIIHSLCNQLMSVLAILTAPLPELYRTFQSDACFGLAEASSSHTPFWLSSINPRVFPLDLLREGVESEVSALWLLKLVSSAPGFSSALVLQAALHSDCLLLRLLLSQSHLCMCSEVEVSPEVEKAGAEFVEAIFSILSSLNNFPRALAQVFEDYVERRQLWDRFYSLADSAKEDLVLFKCVRAVLLKPISTLIGHLVSMIQACEELPVPLFRQEILERVQAKIPKEWNYTPQDARNKDTNKSTISLAIQALSFIFTHLPSSVASLPLSVRFLFHTAEKHLCHRARQLRPTGLLIYALLCCLCQGLEDGETLEQVSAEPLERGVKERLALLSECLRVSLGQEKGVPKPTVHKILQGLEEKRPKWSAMQLQKALKLCSESAFERVESNLVQERGVPSEPAEQKMGTALLALCQLAGGIQNLQQIHHAIQLNEGLLRSRLSSDVDGSISPEGQQSVLFWSTENKTSSPVRFNPLFHFDHIGHAEFDQAALSEREWDWARLLSSYQRLSQVTFRHLLANRWEMQDGAVLEEEEQILVERLKKGTVVA